MSSPPLFDFKAGRVEFDEKTGQAKPLAGQGRVTLLRSSEDPSLLGIQWLPRGSNSSSSASEELLLVPGDVEFSHLSQCQTGRVIQMRFHSSGERHLFWLQDAPKGDLHVFSAEDENILAKLNELANSVDEESDDDAMDDGEGAAGAEAASESGLHVDPIKDPVNSVQPASDRSENGPGAQNEAQSTLYEALGERLAQHRRREQLPLSHFINPSKRASHVRSASEDQIQELLQHAEGIASNRQDLLEVVSSPYFAQSFNQLGSAVLESPALAHELGLSKVPGSTEELLEELRRALRKN